MDPIHINLIYLATGVFLGAALAGAIAWAAIIDMRILNTMRENYMDTLITENKRLTAQATRSTLSALINLEK